MLKKNIYFFILIFIRILICGNAISSAENTWTTEAVDALKYFTDFSSRAIAIDKNNHPHMAYGGAHLYYTYFDGTEWKYETIDISNGVGRYASIAIDTNNKVHISYYDDDNGALKYATNVAGSWVTSNLDNAGSMALTLNILLN